MSVLEGMLVDNEIEDGIRDSEQISILDSFSLVDKRIIGQFNTRRDELNKFALMLENPQDLQNKHSKLRILSNLSYGFRKASESVAWSSFLLGEAKNRRRTAEAVAQHDNFWDYVDKKEKEGKKTKTTESYVKSYVDLDEDVQTARREEAMLLAMHLQFLGLKQEFSQGISTIRTVFNPYAEENQMTSAADSSAVGYEEKV